MTYTSCFKSRSLMLIGVFLHTKEKQVDLLSESLVCWGQTFFFFFDIHRYPFILLRLFPSNSLPSNSLVLLYHLIAVMWSGSFACQWTLRPNRQLGSPENLKIKFERVLNNVSDYFPFIDTVRFILYNKITIYISVKAFMSFECSLLRLGICKTFNTRYTTALVLK